MSSFATEYPQEAKVVRSALYSSFVALAIGGIFGFVQALYRADIWRPISEFDYYTVLTVHGVFLVIAFTIFFLVGVFTWAVTESLERGPLDMRITWSWYGLMIVGALLAGISIFAGFVDSIDMSADVLFTFYAPMQAHPLFYLGLAVFVVGTWVAGLDWFRTWLAWRKDHPGQRIPLPTFMVLTTMLMWYISSIGVAVAVLVFLLPWSLGLLETINPLLTRTLFWYFGHPVVYFWLMPAYLLWYLLLPKLAGGRLFSDPLARLVFVIFLILSTPVGIHHQYLDPGIAEGFKFIAMTNTMFLLLPSLLTAFTVVASIEYGARRAGGTGYIGWLRALPWSNPAFTGMVLAGLLFAAGGFSGMINAGMNINYLVHNTMWVPAHFHLTVGTAVALTFMAASYWLIPHVSGRRLYSSQIGLAQVVLWFVGMVLMTNAMFRTGLTGMPRRTAEPQYEGFEFAPVVGDIAELDIQLAIGAGILLLSLLLFLLNILATAINDTVERPVDAHFEAALSGPEDAPRVLDNLRLWVGIALVLVVLAYSLPLWSIISESGLLGPGGRPFPMVIEFIWGFVA